MPCEMAASVSCQGPWRPVELGRLQAAPVQPLCSEGPMGAAAPIACATRFACNVSKG